MTKRQKTVLKRWLFGVFVSTRLAYLMVSYLPEWLQPFQNSPWLDMQISISNKTTNLAITHQSLDPFILTYITLVIAQLYCATTKLGKIATLGLVLPIMLFLNYIVFYVAKGSPLVIGLLEILNYTGLLIIGLTILATGGGAIYLMVLGAVHFFERDQQNKKS